MVCMMINISYMMIELMPTHGEDVIWIVLGFVIIQIIGFFMFFHELGKREGQEEMYQKMRKYKDKLTIK